MPVKKMSDIDLAGKRVLIREDLNVPVRDGKVTSDVRIRAALPTIQAALDAGAAVMLISHLGRPTEGEPADEFSLAPVAAHLSELLDTEVPLITDWLDGVDVEPRDRERRAGYRARDQVERHEHYAAPLDGQRGIGNAVLVEVRDRHVVRRDLQDEGGRTERCVRPVIQIHVSGHTEETTICSQQVEIPVTVHVGQRHAVGESGWQLLARDAGRR